MSNILSVLPLLAAKQALESAQAKANDAEAAQGQPGAMSTVVAAEIASGRFVEEHGDLLLRYLASLNGVEVPHASR